MNKSPLNERSFDFAIKGINLYKKLIIEKEFVLSKQLLRSSTSVGANIRESRNSPTKKDFIYKLSISQKECDESIYWLELLYKTAYIDDKIFNELSRDANVILNMLKRSILTAKQNMMKKS